MVRIGGKVYVHLILSPLPFRLRFKMKTLPTWVYIETTYANFYCLARKDIYTILHIKYKGGIILKRFPSLIQCILAIVMLLTAIGCTTIRSEQTAPMATVSFTPTPDFDEYESYTVQGVYYRNEEMGRTLYAKLIVPKDGVEGEKRPAVIYVHGGTSDWRALLPVAERMAEKGYIGLSLELAGGMPAAAKPAPKSEGAELYPSHYTSRMSDVEAALAFIKTLIIVDTEKLFMYGQSYGGMVTMFTAAKHKELAGIILESSGLKDGHTASEGYNGYDERYDPKGDYETFIQQYPNDVLIVCTDGDELGYFTIGQSTVKIYNARSTGTASFVGLTGGRHSFGMFTDEGKEQTLFNLEMFLDRICNQ